MSSGITWFGIITALFWRFVGCPHNLDVDLGDEEGAWWYCFQCERHLL